jgi:hypothetical protein
MNDEAIKKVISILENNQLNDLARQLQKEWEKLSSELESERQDAFKEIQSLCHVKYFGDLLIKEDDGVNWINLLGQVKQSAAIQLKKCTR